MDDFGPQNLPAVLAACQAALPDASHCFSSALGTPLELALGDTASWSPSQPPAELAGPGLVILIRVGTTGAALVALPESTGLLPEWYAHPNPTEKGQLAVLAQEISSLLMPDSLAIGEAAAGAVSNIFESISRGRCTEGASLVWFTLTAPNGAAQKLALLWPLEGPANVFDPPGDASSPAGSGPRSQKSEAQANSTDVESPTLPAYSRSLLRIKVPVMVTLASKKHAVERIIEIVPGTMIQFNKSCEELLELEVGTQRIANGECVKVGDKFGLSITSLILPAERFHSISAQH